MLKTVANIDCKGKQEIPIYEDKSSQGEC